MHWSVLTNCWAGV